MNCDADLAAGSAAGAPSNDESVVNVAGYRFVALSNLSQRRDQLRSLCADLKVKGTILLSPEGINLFLAGSGAAIEKFVDSLECDADLKGMTLKRSVSRSQPFGRMKVKVKREIIPCSVEGIDPVANPAPTVAPGLLRDWLRDGREVTLLDVRNTYEVDYGTFSAAQSLGIAHFRELPEAVDRLADELKQRPLVIFCTGGIRCEKAGPYLQQQGFDDVYQLEGGILQYFADCGDEHYAGDCFVFDERVAVDSDLRPISVEDPMAGNAAQ